MNLRTNAHRGTVRARTTAGAVAVVGVALIVAAVAMVVLLRRSLTNDVHIAALSRAESIVAQLEAGIDPGNVTLPGDDDQFVQLVDRDGDVVVASQSVSDEAPVADLASGESRQMDASFDDDPFLVVATDGPSRQGTLTVLVGRTLDLVYESTATTTVLLAGAIPVLLLIVGYVTWNVVSRALAPVDSIRSEVESISTEELHRRVPVPPTTDELARLAATMNRMLERLQRGNEKQRRFVSDASHELRSPVASVRQHAELALAHPGTTSTTDLADLVLAENLRLQRVVDDLLMLARADEADSIMARSEVDLDDLVFAEVERTRRASLKRFDTARVSAGRLRGNEKLLTRVVSNLLENADHHARERIALGLYAQDGLVILEVDDDGPGIAAADRERVFDRFVRLDEARDRGTGGSGLGLAIVAELVERHGGAVKVVESPLGGARFEVRFPASA
jgi:signal transduction histidine kinase